MNVLTTENLSKSYKGVLAVDGVNMHIEQGDVYGFVGENGAGKTTVIRLIAGLAAPTSGSFSLFGIDSESPEIGNARKKMGCIVEAVSLNRGMTALENLRLQCMITDTKKTDEELCELISRVGLNPDEVKDKKAGNFSLGMRQRLGIAMVMVSSPEFVVLDEPMNGLDPSGFVEVRETILSLNRQGVTFLVSSHILSELDKVCTKIGVISKGKLLREMSVEELHGNAGIRTIVQLASEEDANKLLRQLSQNDMNYTPELSGSTLVLKGDGDLNSLIQTISWQGISVKKINVLEDTIEDFYMSIIKGEESK